MHAARRFSSFSAAALLLLELATLVASQANTAHWLAKREAVISTIWSNATAIPSSVLQRSRPDSIFRSDGGNLSAYPNVSWLRWDITQRADHQMHTTAWYHPIQLGERSTNLVVMHEGHGGQMNVSKNFSDWVHQTLGCDYIYVWMPLYGPNQQRGYPPHHWYFQQWQAEGDLTIR